MSTLIKDIRIVNEGRIAEGSVLIDGKTIASVLLASDPDYDRKVMDAAGSADEVITGGEDAMLLPGVIDDQVHFREPGATAKGCIASESAAAVLGGTTSFMDMPNNNPPATTLELLEEKYDTAARDSFANYSFYIGATNDNIDELRKADRGSICGIKVFMGSSTGNMLVDSQEALDAIFSLDGWLIATHCEDEATIRRNLDEARASPGTLRRLFHPVQRTSAYTQPRGLPEILGKGRGDGEEARHTPARAACQHRRRDRDAVGSSYEASRHQRRGVRTLYVVRRQGL